MIRCVLGQLERLHLALLLFGLFLLDNVAAAEVKRADEWMYDRLFAASGRPLLKRAIEADREGKTALTALLRYYEDMDGEIRATTSEED